MKTLEFNMKREEEEKRFENVLITSITFGVT